MAVNPKWDLTSVHGLNRFVWAKLQEELEWNKSNYGGLTPLIPSAQQPEINEYNAPYIVYNYSDVSVGDDYFVREEQIVYSIYSFNEKDIRQALNVIREYLNRRDDSARDVNAYINQFGDDRHKKFDYKTTYVLSSYGAQPPISEGGRQDGSISLRVRYTYYDPDTGEERLAL